MPTPAHVPNGRQVQKKIGAAWTERGRPPAGYFTKRLAEAWLRDVLDQARRGTLPGMVRTGATFADAAAEYLRDIEHDRGRKPSTVRGYRAWLTFFAAGVHAAAETTHRRIDGLLTWQENALRRVREAKASGLAERLAGDLVGLPALRAGQVSARYDVTHQAAMNALRRLEQFGLLTSRTDHGRITFRAEDVINLLAQ